MKQIMIICCSLLFLSSCAITSTIERKRLRAEVKFAPKEEKKEEHKAEIHTKVKLDSTEVYILPATTDENGEQVATINLEEVVVVAKLRVLPERKGNVSVDFVITLPKELQGNCQSVVVKPFIHKGGRQEALKELSIRGGLFTKVQGRHYWQFEQYIKLFKPTAMQEQRAFEKFIKYPYPNGVRLDSIVETRKEITYFYNQEVPTKGEGNKMFITLQGWVNGLDGSYYKLPPSDTLEYNISSMLTFIDKTPRYVTKVIEKYAVVNDKNYLSFPVSSSDIVDTLAQNKQQLSRIESLMAGLINQQEFYVDSIILTASSSLEGSYSLNNRLSKDRAFSLRDRLVAKFGKDVKKLITVRWIAEDWEEFSRLLESSDITNKGRIAKIIEKEKNLDARELAVRRAYPKEYRKIKEGIYPRLRSVSFKYDLRRVGMVKDTIHTTELDSVYLDGMRFLEKREYSKAYKILKAYQDHNCALAMMSLGYDDEAYKILRSIPENDKTLYLRAILCYRLARFTEGKEAYAKSCELNSAMEFRGKLDPEITNLLKE